MDQSEYAWAAGFYEGEGYITAQPSSYAIKMGVFQKDHWALLQWGRIVECGKLVERPPSPSRYGTSDEWFVFGPADCRHVCDVLRPWLSPRRRGQIDVAWAKWGTRLKGPKMVCKRGHPLEGENLYVNPLGYRQCRICVHNRAVQKRGVGRIIETTSDLRLRR